MQSVEKTIQEIENVYDSFVKYLELEIYNETKTSGSCSPECAKIHTLEDKIQYAHDLAGIFTKNGGKLPSSVPSFIQNNKVLSKITKLQTPARQTVKNQRQV